jgi:hypothetical protein
MWSRSQSVGSIFGEAGVSSATKGALQDVASGRRSGEGIHRVCYHKFASQRYEAVSNQNLRALPRFLLGPQRGVLCTGRPHQSLRVYCRCPNHSRLLRFEVYLAHRNQAKML